MRLGGHALHQPGEDVFQYFRIGSPSEAHDSNSRVNGPIVTVWVDATGCTTRSTSTRSRVPGDGCTLICTTFVDARSCCRLSRM